MKLLFCCELYSPVVCGVQVVMRQIAERLSQRGHDVTVVTTKLSNRNFTSLAGVKIVEFDISGNIVNGMYGDIQAYRDFVATFECDAILIKAAQQWTFDALWPVFDKITAKILFIPCGFSALYEPSYQKYYAEMPVILKKLDHLIFYAENYRDINFAKQHQLINYTIIPNGADEREFNVKQDSEFRKRYGIIENSFVFLTVGGLTGIKGHLEVAEAFSILKTHGVHATLILNGNNPGEYIRKFNTDETVTSPGTLFSKLFQLLTKARQMYRQNGMQVVAKKIYLKLQNIFSKSYAESLSSRITQIKSQKDKQVIQVDLSREELIQAFLTANLFVFASHVEYSPLVLFEAIAAGTPFLSVPVGNAAEIARWTGGGIICPAKVNKYGYVRVKASAFANMMHEWMHKKDELAMMGKFARQKWKEKYTWATISLQYEKIFKST